MAGAGKGVGMKTGNRQRAVGGSKKQRYLYAIAELITAAQDVIEQFELTLLPVGPDLADSIRVFLKPALLKYQKLAQGSAGCGYLRFDVQLVARYAPKPAASVAAAKKKGKA